MRIAFPLFVYSFSLSLLLFQLHASSFARDRDDTITLLFLLRARRIRDEREREREKETLENLIEFAVVGRVGRGPFSANNSSPLLLASLFTLFQTLLTLASGNWYTC